MTDDEKAKLDQRMLFDMLYMKAIDALKDEAEGVLEHVARGRFEQARQYAESIATAAKILADALVQAREQT